MGKICVIGMGYVGTTLAVTLADVGFEVMGVEINPEVRAALLRKQPHFHEIGLERLLEKHVGKKLAIVDRPEKGACDTYIICVATPIGDDKRPKLDYVERASEEVAQCLKGGETIILRSTVPVGSTRDIVIPCVEKISGLKCGKDFHVVFAPERTLEGKALDELRELPQIIGGYDPASSAIASSIFMKVTPTLMNVSSLEAAEIVKILDNTYRDVRFAYSNEISLICEHLGINAAEVIKAANMGYSRNSIPLPSPGVGGACLSKDPHILVDLAQKHGYNANLIKIGREINESMPGHVVSNISRTFASSGKQLRGSKIFVIGFAFKGTPETSDTRQSPTIPVVRQLLEEGARVYGYDPVASESDIKAIGAIPTDLEKGFQNADCILFMNNHSSYKNISLDSLLDTTNRPCVFIDGWNMFSRDEIKEKSYIAYGGVGCQIH